MKLGMSTWVKDFVGPDNIDEVFKGIRSLDIPDEEGRPTVEVFASDDLELAKLIKKKAMEYGFRTAALGFFPYVNDKGAASPHMSSPDPAERKAAIETVQKWIEFTREITVEGDKAVISGPFHTRHNFKENKAKPSEEFGYLVEGLSAVGEKAKQEGVYAGMEILNRFECRGLNKVDDMLHLVKKVANKNLGIHWDSSHAFIDDKDLIDSLNTAINSGYLVNVHFSENDRSSAIGKGGIGNRFETLIKMLDEAGKTGKYDGFSTIELFFDGMHSTVGIPATVTDDTTIKYDSMEIAKESIDYIRRQMDKIK